MSDRKGLSLDDRIRLRQFRDADVLAALDDMDEQALRYLLGNPRVRQSWERSGWDDHAPRPALASDDPAVMAAIGRCASWRQRGVWPGPSALPGHVHPEPCGWDGYPLPELLRALSWATWASGHLESESLLWEGHDGSTYVRPGSPERWEHPAWAEFASLDREGRTARVMAAVAASRE